MSALSPRAFVFTAVAFSLVSGGALGQLFSTPRYPVGPAPYSIAAGDLNGDGKPDLATSNYNANTLSVLLSTAADPTGTGGYAPAATYVVGNAPYMVAVADADNDGKLDLLTACYASDLVAFMKGNGLGGFGPVIALFAGNGPACVAVADFNGDGWKDVASANFDDSTVSLMKGNGAGGFLAAAPYSTGFHPNHVLAADLNADAKPDAVTANYGTQTISVLLNNGAGGLGLWTGFSAGDAPFSLASGDVDSDGDLDLAVSAAVSNEVRVFKNNGSGSPMPSQTFPMASTPVGLAFADVHGDGKTDLLVAAQGSAPMWWGEVFVFNGTGAILNSGGQELMSGTQSTDVVALDLDLDGDVDVASANAVSNDVVVHRNFGGGVLTLPPWKTKYSGALFYPNDIAAVDLNDDGQLDVVATSGFVHTKVSTARGHGDGFFDEPSFVEVFTEQRGLAVGDLSGNRTLDLAVTGLTGNTVVTKLGDGAGGFGSTFTSSGGGAQIGRMAIGDLTSDGRPDLLVAHGASPGLTVHVGNGVGGFLDPPAPINSIPTVDVRVEDMDGNGYADLVTSTGTTVAVWFGVAPSNFAPPASSQTTTSTGRMAIGDVTGDGRLDAVTGASGGNVVIVPGAVNFGWGSSTTIPVTTGGALIPKLADLDGDGKLDLVVGNPSSGQYPTGLHVLLGNGFGGFGPPTRFMFETSPQAISIADVDADGRPDVVMACQNILSATYTEIVVVKNLLGTPVGVAPFGAGTPGAYGRLGMNASGSARVGNSAFALECTNAPRFALGIALVGNVSNVAGADTFGLGLLLHVDLLASTVFLSFDMKSDPEGDGRVSVPIPNVPAFVGATFQAQSLWVEKSTTGQLTSDAFLGLVSSKGLTFVIQP